MVMDGRGWGYRRWVEGMYMFMDGRGWGRYTVGRRYVHGYGRKGMGDIDGG